jgi:hypothetical protein
MDKRMKEGREPAREYYFHAYTYIETHTNTREELRENDEHTYILRPRESPAIGQANERKHTKASKAIENKREEKKKRETQCRESKIKIRDSRGETYRASRNKRSISSAYYYTCHPDDIVSYKLNCNL